MKKLMLLALLLSSVVAYASIKPEGKQFYIYTEAASRLNHYIPSGYMGDYGDIKINPRHKEMPASGETCIRVEYTAERKQNAGWAGVYWMHPDNNWGNKKGGFDLTGFTKLKFKARGAKGGEYLDKFGIGGIGAAEHEGDSDENSIGPVELTTKWTEYTIDLTGLDLSHIIGGFLWAANSDSNPKGMVFFLDEIRLEK